MNGIRIRFETKPGKSLATAGVLPSSCASSVIASAVSSEVSRPRTTSTSFSTGTGLKKCMPITRSGRDVTAASDVIGIEDVFEARIAPSGRSSSARRKTSCLTSASSITASISRSAPLKPAESRSSTGSRRASTSPGSAPPFSASFSRLLRIVARPRSVAPGAASWSETRRPEAATTWAIPPPIWPAPTTRTCSKAMPRGGYRVGAMPVVDVNGARLWYDEAGSGPAVLLLHGGLGDSGLWEPVVPFLAERYRTIRADLRFYGRSTGPNVPWSWQDDAIGVLDGLAVERAALVGLSLGGKLALDIALAHPDRLWAVAGVAPGLGGHSADAYSDEQEARYEAAEAANDLEA